MIHGTLPAAALRDLIARGGIAAEAGIDDVQVQPASVDLCLSADAYRMPGSVLALPGERVQQLARDLALEKVSLTAPTVLARGQVYWVRLREHLRLPPGWEAYTNSKSSTGRVDVATRVLTDGNPRYDRIAAGYEGDLWLEITPRSFDVVVQSGVSLNQMIVFYQRDVLDQPALEQRWQRTPLLYAPDGEALSCQQVATDGRVLMGADLNRDVVGYVAKRSHQPLNLIQRDRHVMDDFFEPVQRPGSGYLFLERGRFYILATRERVMVPADLACEMVPYDPAAGEFRAHYAGFFDPGWGMPRPAPSAEKGAEKGLVAVLEVRPHEDDLILRHGQPICAMAYEQLSADCTDLYGAQGNNYADQNGPRLSKHFKAMAEDR